MSALQPLLDLLRSLLQWWVVVMPWEEAVRVRCGSRQRRCGPGVWLRIPLLDRFYKQSIRLRATSLTTQTLSTRDGRSLTVAGMLSYRIADIGKLYNGLHHGEATIQGIALGLVGDFVTSATSPNPADLRTFVEANLDLQRYGIAEVGFRSVCFAYVRSYRLITGEGGQWVTARHDLDTDRAIGDPPPS